MNCRKFSTIFLILFYAFSSFGMFDSKTLNDCEEMDLIYCSMGPTTPWNDFIRGFTFGTIDNYPVDEYEQKSGNVNPVGVHDYTALSTDITSGASYTVSATIKLTYWGAPNTTGNGYFYAWIDFNGDDDFDDAGESVVYESILLPVGENDNLLINQSITVPAGAVAGATRMRIITRSGGVPTPCDGTQFNGEVEDYMVNIIAGTDIIRPQPVFSGPVTTNGNFNVDLTFGEPLLAAPTITDFVINNGTITNISANGDDYVLAISPVNTGDVTLSLPENMISDLAGNLNLASALYTCVYAPPGALILTYTVVDESAPSAANGSIDLTVSGGQSPYGFSWNTGAITEDLNNLSGATYTVTVSDANSLTETVAIIVNTLNPPPAGDCSSPENVALNKAANQNTTNNVAVAGGAVDGDLAAVANWPPDNFSQTGWGTTDWWEVDLGESYQIQSMNFYKVNHSVAGNEEFSDFNIYISETPFPAGVTNEPEVGTFNGVVANPGSTYNFTAPFPVGRYVRLQKTVSGLLKIGEVEVMGCLPGPSVLTLDLNPTQPSSPIANDGAVVATVSGGEAPYYYIWSNGSTASSINNLPLGYYSLTVTDNTGEIISENIDLVFSTDPLSVQLTATNTSGQNTADGSVNTVVSGGWPPYQYSWNNGATSANLSNLINGLYGVTVTDVLNNIVSAQTVIGIGTTGLILSGVVTNESGLGQADGSIDLSVSGGSSPYCFHWNNGVITEDLNNIHGGVYAVTVSDNFGITEVSSFTVETQNSGGPSTCASLQNLSEGKAVNQSSVQQGNTSTTQEEAARSVDGETNMLWNPNSYSFIGWGAQPWWEVDLGEVFQLEEVRLWNVVGGDAFHLTNYYLFVSENPFSSNDPNVLLTQSEVWSLTVNEQAARPSTLPVGALGRYVRIQLQGSDIFEMAEVQVMGCAVVPDANMVLGHTVVPATGLLAMDGAIDVSVFGGTAPYSYIWSNSETTEDLVMLSGGIYDLTVTDSGGEVEYLSVNLPVENISPEGVFHTLTKKLDGGFVVTNSLDLRFKYLERYQPESGEKLSYKIISKTGPLYFPNPPDLINVLTNTNGHEYGMNFYKLDFQTLNLPLNEVYTLIVENGNKGEIYYLKFRTQCSIECIGLQN